jgi:hypothetical protein
MEYFKNKNSILVNFGGPCDGKYWYIIWPFAKFYGNLVHFVAICQILWLFGIYFPVLVCCPTKNLATLPQTFTLTLSSGFDF